MNNNTNANYRKTEVTVHEIGHVKHSSCIIVQIVRNYMGLSEYYLNRESLILQEFELY